MQAVTIPAPSSKSLSHRALIAAGLAGGASRLSHVLESDDIERTRDILSALGARFERGGPGLYTVSGVGGAVRSPSGQEPLSIFVGESGTTCRLMTAVLAAGQGLFHIHGAGRMHDRPIGELTDVLEKLGTRISFEEKRHCPPLLLEASGLGSSSDDETVSYPFAEIGCDESSQYISGLLLAAPLGAGLTILLGGRKAVSWPYVSLTLDVMEAFGIGFHVEQLTEKGWTETDWRSLKRTEPGKLRFHVRPGAYQAREFSVEGDWSGASYFLAAGAIGPKPVCVTGLNRDSLQGDAALLGILQAMGARIEAGDEGITVFPSPLRGIDADMGHCPDLVPTVAALAAHARGTTRISNAAHLKIKESDRLAAPAEELSKAGCKVRVTDDGLVIEPPEKGLHAPLETVFSAHNDHRMAMSLSLLGLAGISGAKGFSVTLDDTACVAKSFPHFWALWEKVTA